MSTVKRFEDLEIWKEARRLSKVIFRLTIETELNRDFRFKEQI